MRKKTDRHHIVAKSISIIVAVTLLLSDVSYAFQAERSDLAIWTKLTSTEFQHAAQIVAGVRLALKDLETVDMGRLKSLGEKPITRRSVFSDRIRGSIDFGAAEEVEMPSSSGLRDRKNYVVKAVVDGVEYACQISISSDKSACDVYAAPYNKYAAGKKAGTVKVVADLLDPQSRAIIDSYVEHEVSGDMGSAVDPWIAERMASGTYAVDGMAEKSNPIYDNPSRGSFSHGAYLQVSSSIRQFLRVAGVRNTPAIMSAVLARPLVIIPYMYNEDLPAVTVAGQTVRVTAHSSEFATYIFVPDSLYRELTGERPWSETAAALIESELVHEIGARCGLPCAVETGAAVNVLDAAYRQYIREGRPKTLFIHPERARSLQGMKIANLLDLEKRNDYASGKQVDDRSIFMRVMLPIIASGILAASTAAAANDSFDPPSDFLTKEEAMKPWSPTPGVVYKDDYTLWEKYKSTNALRRIESAHILGHIGGIDSARMLMNALDDPELYVSMVAEEELTKISADDDQIIRYLLSMAANESPRKSVYSMQRLAKLGKRALPTVINGLRRKGYREEESNALILVMMGEIAVEPTIKALEDPDLKIGARVTLQKMAKLDKNYDLQSDLSILTRLIKVKNEPCQDTAERRFIELGEGCIFTMIALLGDEDPDVRVRAARILGAIGSARAMKPMEEMMRKETNTASEVYTTMEDALKKIRTKNSLPVNDIKKKGEEEGEKIKEKKRGPWWWPFGKAEKINSTLWQRMNGDVGRFQADLIVASTANISGRRHAGDEKLPDAWAVSALTAVMALRKRAYRNRVPDRADIEGIAIAVRERDIEVYVPASQIPNGKAKNFRMTLERVFGDRLRIYQAIDDLGTMIKDPEKAVVMATGLSGEDIGVINSFGSRVREARFINFQNIPIDTMTDEEYESYIAENLSILLLARMITEKEVREKSSPVYRFLAHLLEDHIKNPDDIDAYLQVLTDSSIDPVTRLSHIVKNILTAMPMVAYKAMRPALEILWSA